MEDPELWTVYTSQLIALAAVLAATLGTLRKRDVLTANALEAVFRFADKHLPDTAQPVGSNLLAHMKMMAEVAAGHSDTDPPHRRSSTDEDGSEP
jgi:hypothetical protein